MPAPPPPDEFARIWRENGSSPAAVARALDISVRNVYSRRARLEAHGYRLPTAEAHKDNHAAIYAYTPRAHVHIEDGCAVIWSDAHIWPGRDLTPAEGALLAVLNHLDPEVIICNGDELDGAKQSRHGPLGWEKKPGMDEELAALQTHMRRIEEHAKRARKFRTIGNHTRRYDYHLSRTAPDYRGIRGMRLSDHLPNWSESWSVHINDGIAGGHCVVKHKIGNGVTAGRTNAIKAGVTIVTGHTHRLSVDCIETYAGRHYGVQCGTLADPRGPQFEYAEDAPDAGRAGFVVMTWRSGILQPPELVECDDAGVAWFRGEPVTVKPRIRVRAETR